MLKNTLLILICSLLCILSGCQSVEQVPTPSATLKTIPTVHPTTTPHITPTVIPSSTITPLPPLDQRESYPSPDGQWHTILLERQISGTELQQVFKIINFEDDAISWVAEDRVQEDGLAYQWPIPLLWGTHNLYFSHQHSGDGCFVSYDFRGSDLWQINLLTGDVKQLAPAVGYWLAVSPDETALAYLTHSGDALVLRDIASGAERRTELALDADYPDELVYKSNLLWSPDSSSLVLTAEIGACSGVFWYAIVHIDAATFAQTVLVNENSHLYKTVDWPTAERILLRDQDNAEWWLYWNDPTISSTPLAVNPALENEPFKAYITFLKNWYLDECWENAMTQYDMNLCAGQQTERSYQMLTQFVEQYMAVLNPDKQQNLQEVQELWEQYKQQDCDRVFEAYDGGTIGPMNYALCLDMHYRHRLESLVSECRSQ